MLWNALSLSLPKACRRGRALAAQVPLALFIFLVTSSAFPAQITAVGLRAGSDRAGSSSESAMSANESLPIDQRTCNTQELFLFALRAATGRRSGVGPKGEVSKSDSPIRPPDCAPGPGKGLPPLLVHSTTGPQVVAAAASGDDVYKETRSSLIPQRHHHLALRSVVRHVNASLASQQQSGQGGVATAPYLAHVSVYQSDLHWCDNPCESPTWELAAPKPESAQDGAYVLYEVAIWRQERRLALYRFDKAWAGKAQMSYNELCGGKSWGCPAYRGHREARRLLSLPWAESTDKDRSGKALSSFLLDAFKQVFDRVRKESPKAKHIGLSYSGHGSNADGSLFQGAVGPHDARSLLSSASGGPFGLGFLNFGGNCAESRWLMLERLSEFGKYVIASDLEVGGYDISNQTDEEQNLVIQAQEQLSDAAVLKKVAEEQQPLKAGLEEVMESRKQLWETALKDVIFAQKLRQSSALFDSTKFEPFAKALKAAYAALTPEEAAKVRTAAEALDCDVLGLVRALPKGADAVEAKFLAFRDIYVSTRGITGKWDRDAPQGLSLNFLGWKAPPCNFEAAGLGKNPKIPEYADGQLAWVQLHRGGGL